MKRSPSVVVTGASGFIGANLVQQLLEQNWSVSILVRESSAPSLTKSQKDRVKVIVDDSKDTSEMRLAEDLLGADLVFHLASLFLSNHKPADIPRLVESNILFGARLLEAMKQAGITKLVNTGTSWQHFEDQQNVPVNLYAATKTAFQALIDFYTSAGPLQCVTLKLFDTYGPQDPRAKLVHLLMKAAKTGETLALSPGEQKIDLVHVRDVAEAFIVAAELLVSGSIHRHESFVVSSGNPISIKVLVDRLQRAIGADINARFGERPYRDREVMVPYSKGKPLPGWQARLSLEEGLRETFEASFK